MTEAFDLDGNLIPVQEVSMRAARKKKLKKVAKPKKPVPPRIVIVCADNFTPKIANICKVLKSLDLKTIEFCVLSQYRSGEKVIENVLNYFKIPVYYSMPWMLPNSGYIQRGKILKLFKPTLILAFAEKSTECQSVIDFERLARRANIEFKQIVK